jgi:hypothetical protein
VWWLWWSPEAKEDQAVLVFVLPMVFWFALAGVTIGLAAGLRLTGRCSDALALALLLGLSPGVAFWLAGSIGFRYDAAQINDGQLQTRADKTYPLR